MRNLIVFITSACVLYGCSIVSYKESDPSCDILNWGLVSLETADFFKYEEQSFSGRTLVHDGILITRTTTEILLEFGTSFGVEHNFKNIPHGELVKKTVLHPRFVKNDGTSSSSETIFISPSEIGSSWIINREWELVKGEWEFRFEYNDKLLCSKRFKTI